MVVYQHFSRFLDKGNYTSYYDDPNIYNNPDVRNNGLILMEQAFGSPQNQRKIYHRIYLSTGIDPDTLHLILPFVTTLALSALYKKARTPSKSENLKVNQNSQVQNQVAFQNHHPIPQQAQAPKQPHNSQEEMHLQIQRHLETQQQHSLNQQQYSNTQHHNIPQQVPRFAQQEQSRPVQQQSTNAI